LTVANLKLLNGWRAPAAATATLSIAPGSIYDRLRAQTRLRDAGQH